MPIWIQLYYDPDRRKFTDENGNVMYDIFRIITPNMYKLFLQDREYKIFETKKNLFVELMWPEDEDLEYDPLV